MGANLRHQVLLSTTMLVAALGGYARRAYAGATGGACTATGPSTYQCSGSYSVPQTVSADNATVTTVAGFSVNTAAGNAITITGNGAISYEDYNASSLTAAGLALQITLQRRYCKRQCGQRPPSTRTATAGSRQGIKATNTGSGAVNITANGDVTGTSAGPTPRPTSPIRVSSATMRRTTPSRATSPGCSDLDPGTVRASNGPMTARIDIVEGDITTLPVDAIVNAANEALAPGGGVCGAIHRAAGPELAGACAALGGCATGEAKITPGFNLPARYVIHAVGPVWGGGERGEGRLLADCYRNSLKLAAEHDLTSIAFPAISTGIYGFPADRAALIALRTVRETLPEVPGLTRVVFCCFGRDSYELHEAALAATAPQH